LQSARQNLFFDFRELRPANPVVGSGDIHMPKSVPRKKRRELRGRALVVATPKFKIQFAEPVARRWLKEFFGRPARAGLLPRKVCRWLAQHDRIKLSRSLVARQGDTRLYLKRQNSYVPRTVSLLLELIRGRGRSGVAGIALSRGVSARCSSGSRAGNRMARSPRSSA